MARASARLSMLLVIQNALITKGRIGTCLVVKPELTIYGDRSRFPLFVLSKAGSNCSSGSCSCRFVQSGEARSGAFQRSIGSSSRTSLRGLAFRETSAAKSWIRCPPCVALSAKRGEGDWSPIPAFKGWTKPGAMPPGIEVSGPPEEGESLDALVGHYRIFQLKDGNKYTTDDVLCSWYATSWCPSASSALDLGSGIGSVALMSAWRLRGTRFVTVEAQEMSTRLATKSARFNGVDHRFDVRHGDLRDPTVLGNDEVFDMITGTPPYFPPESGVDSSNHPQKQACRFELRGTVADYCETAAKHLAPGGLFVVAFPISPPFQKTRLLQAADDAGLKMVRFRPICFREGDTPLLGLLALSLKNHLPDYFEPWIEPPLIIRNLDGSLHPEFAALRLSMGMQPR